MFVHTNRTCCWPAPTTSLQSRNVISRRKRSATEVRMSTTDADVSVQKKARHPVGSLTSTTRIAPPTGRQECLGTLDHRGGAVQVEHPGRPTASLARPLGQVDLIRARGPGPAATPRLPGAGHRPHRRVLAESAHDRHPHRHRWLVVVDVGALDVRSVTWRRCLVEGEGQALGSGDQRLDRLNDQSCGDTVGLLAGGGDGGITGSELVAELGGADPSGDDC